jgi:hypothetical protein
MKWVTMTRDAFRGSNQPLILEAMIIDPRNLAKPARYPTKTPEGRTYRRVEHILPEVSP